MVSTSFSVPRNPLPTAGGGGGADPIYLLRPEYWITVLVIAATIDHELLLAFGIDKAPLPLKSSTRDNRMTPIILHLPIYGNLRINAITWCSGHHSALLQMYGGQCGSPRSRLQPLADIGKQLPLSVMQSSGWNGGAHRNAF